MLSRTEKNKNLYFGLYNGLRIQEKRFPGAEQQTMIRHPKLPLVFEYPTRWGRTDSQMGRFTVTAEYDWKDQEILERKPLGLGKGAEYNSGIEAKIITSLKKRRPLNFDSSETETDDNDESNFLL